MNGMIDDKEPCDKCDEPTDIGDMERLHGQTICQDCFELEADFICDVLGGR